MSYNSDGERRFAGQLDRNETVALYIKLPKAFFISTPVGKYSPDWAIAFHEGAARHVYFVAETKGSNDTLELRGVDAGWPKRPYLPVSDELKAKIADDLKKLNLI